jgi:hypothetical protein
VSIFACLILGAVGIGRVEETKPCSAEPPESVELCRFLPVSFVARLGFGALKKRSQVRRSRRGVSNCVDFCLSHFGARLGLGALKKRSHFRRSGRRVSKRVDFCLSHFGARLGLGALKKRSRVRRSRRRVSNCVNRFA